MGAIIKSVSLNYDEDAFLKDYQLSPTQLLKEKIWEMRGMIKTAVQHKIDKQANIIEQLYAQIKHLEDELLEKERNTPKQ